MPPSSEDRLIDWLGTLSPASRLGDDVARLGDLEGAVATVDHQIEGVHFQAGLDPAWLARRLLAVNLSDLAASGADPAYAILALAAPVDFDHRRFLRALVRACERAGVILAGGDTARSDRVSLSLQLLGRTPSKGQLVGRHDARSGDRLWLGGTVGQSALGRALLEAGAAIEGRSITLPQRFREPAALQRAARQAVRRHLAPQPQIELGRWLSGRQRAAAIDLSDGLALDLARLCRASSVGARLELAAIPIAPGTHRLAALLKRDPWQLALGGGEDYVLLFALPARVRPPQRFGCVPVGRVKKGTALELERDGNVGRLEPTGWSHLDPPGSSRR
jgi:thiamine-monophosphate kinase